MNKKKQCEMLNVLSTADLFKLSRIYACSAQKLCSTNSPLDLFGMGFLLHLSLELFLKGCSKVYNNNGYCKTHNLIHLVNHHLLQPLDPCHKLSIDIQDNEILEYFDKCHNLRYEVNVVGTDDIYKYSTFIEKIINQSEIIKVEYEKSSRIYDEVEIKGQKILKLKIGKFESFLMERQESNIEYVLDNIYEHFKHLAKAMGCNIDQTKEFTIIKSALKSPIYNIVWDTNIQPENLTIKINDIINNFNDKPFTWWINPITAKKTNIVKRLEKLNFVETVVKAWTLSLTNLKIKSTVTNILIKCVDNKQDLQLFFNIIKETHSIKESVFYTPLLASIPNTEKFFIGYMRDKPVAIAMLYCNRSIASIFNLHTIEYVKSKSYDIDMLLYLIKYAQDCDMKYVSTLTPNDYDAIHIYKDLGFKNIEDIRCFEKRN